VPGRDIKVQSWYQGGISVFDFTDPQNPYEIAFFDRGPLDETRLQGGGHWSAYWFNGFIYGAEMVRGLDVLELLPNEHLTRNELEAAKLVHMAEFNPQHQPKLEWPTSYVVARAYLDQLVRGQDIEAALARRIEAELARAEGASAGERGAALNQLAVTAAELEAQVMAAATRNTRSDEVRRKALLAGEMRDLSQAMR